MGYRDNDFDFVKIIITFIFILLPMLIKAHYNVLKLFFIIIYLLLYIPILITFYFQYDSISIVIYNQFIIFVGFLIIFSVPKMFGYSNYEFKNFKLKNLLILDLFIVSVLFLTNLNSFSLVSFQDVYEQRAKVSYGSAILGYLMMWSTYLLNPIVLILSLLENNVKIISFTLLCSVIIYGINASKVALFIPILIIVFFYILKRGQGIYKTIPIVFSVIIILLTVFAEKFFILSAVILMRTFGISGLLTYQYNEFFEISKTTGFSHVNFINYLTNNYPYGEESLGVVVSKYFDENSVANANANFIATDGIASMGIEGTIFACFFLGVFLGVWKTLTNNRNFLFMTLLLVPFSFIILNVSFFTAIFSGGYLFCVIFLFSKKVSH